MKVKPLKRMQRQMVLCMLCSNCSATCCSFKARGWESYTPRARVVMSRFFSEGGFADPAPFAERLFACTMCRECDVTCDAGFSPWELFQSARAELWASGAAPSALKPFNDAIKEAGNPFAFNKEARGDWATRAGNMLATDNKNLLFAGCIPAFKQGDALAKIARAYHAMGKPLSVIPGSRELCCGLPALDSGNVDLFNDRMAANIKAILDLAPERVVFACPSCYSFVKEHYGKESTEFGKIPLVFFTDDVIEGIHANRLKVKGFDSETLVSYHDPCHLGRFTRLWDSPRDIIKAVPNARYLELDNCKEHTACCGAGGQMMVTNPADNKAIADKRVGEAVEKNAAVLVNTCFTCQDTLQGAAFRVAEDLDVVHILDLVDV
ncbi:MAG: (Fe-S)-binding protein [Candidatus Lokiarchaeota archaeon]|nr:(Fe-S)-binding protein [Candidatus Lokiarchaeota archaeon]